MGFPPADAGGENPVIGGGDLAMLLSDSDNAKTVMAALAETDIGNDAAGLQLVHLAAHGLRRVPLPERPDPQLRRDAYSKSTSFLFDGSDQMPGEVGAGTFWQDMTAWISGQEDLDTALSNIDASWPSS